MILPRPQPCLTRREGGVCPGTLLPVTAREWRCTEGHTMWGSGALRSEPWPADRPPEPFPGASQGDPVCIEGRMLAPVLWSAAAATVGLLVWIWWRRWG